MAENIFIKRLEVTKDIAPLKAGLVVDFTKSTTILVGDNGVGKSTIMDALGDYFKIKDDTYLKRNMGDSIRLDVGEDVKVKFLDFHGGDRKFSGAFGDDYGLQLAQMRASSGQVTMSIINTSKLHEFRNGVVLLDEPCRGLSIKNQYLIPNIVGKLTRDWGCQVIMTTHSSIIFECLQETAQFYSVEYGQDTTYNGFMLDQLNAAAGLPRQNKDKSE